MIFCCSCTVFVNFFLLTCIFEFWPIAKYIDFYLAVSYCVWF